MAGKEEGPSGAQRIIEWIDARLDRMENRLNDRMDGIADKAEKLAIGIGKHEVEIKNIRDTDEKKDKVFIGMVLAVIGAWAAHFFNWLKGR